MAVMPLKQTTCEEAKLTTRTANLNNTKKKRDHPMSEGCLEQEGSYVCVCLYRKMYINPVCPSQNNSVVPDWQRGIDKLNKPQVH